MVLNFKTTIEASIKTTQDSIKNYQTEKEKITQIKPQQQRDEKTTSLNEHKTKLTKNYLNNIKIILNDSLFFYIMTFYIIIVII
ncbi:hypothetical protein [Candidatus Phytoplasma asteris]|uniref:hypothetical protein n=1 Tax=Candidatus Phytoplasma asteris TaxID=85620 RepID=UPI0039DF4F88